MKLTIIASPVSTTPSPGRPDPPRHDPGDGFIMRHLGVRIAKALFGKVYNDLARMEDVLRESGLGWTILRPPSSPVNRSPAPTAPPSGATPTAAGPSPALSLSPI